MESPPFFMTGCFESRLRHVREAIASAGADALVITHLPNIFYVCGFSGSNGTVLVLGDAVHLFTDGRYTIQVHDEAPGARAHIVRTSLADACGDFLKARASRSGMRLAFEAGSLNVAEWSRFKKAAGARVKWQPTTGLVERIREVKSAEELGVMRESARIASEVVAEAPEFVRPGVAEMEVAAEIEYRLRRKGASGPSFETIVASGPRSALPHARPTEKRLQKNELVVLDLGAILRHYCSDVTRTVFLGRAPSRIRRWYKAVQVAQEAAHQALHAGVSAGNVDRAARGLLRQRGLGRYFVHGTGHGLGIEIHETPRVGRHQKPKIRAGNVVTLEPGIYVEGVGGIRLEDEVAVHAHGTEVLTTAPRELLEL
jgi:Xaa-Pro aminopeptidase